MKYESTILKRLIDTYGVVGNPRYISEIIKEFIVRGKERFPELFTYQADWLAHIDEFGLNPSYTVSYTGQSIYAPNTLERPVKSAILKGNTLVNLIRTINKTILEKYQDVVKVEYIEPTTKYLLKIKNNTSETKSFYSGEITEWTNIDIDANQTITKILTTKSTLGRNTLLQNAKTHTTEHDLSVIFIKYQQGMEDWDIPYFEGMQSVKMPVLKTTGENLIDESNMIIGEGVNSSTGVFTKDLTRKRSDFIRIDSTSIYYVGLDSIFCYDENKNYLGRINTPIGGDVLTGTKFVVGRASKETENIMLSSSQSPYKPYQSNILTVNEEVDLRGIGDVQDTLDLMTGEVVQNIYELILDGSQNIDSDGKLFYYYLPLGVHNNRSNSDKLPSITVAQILDGLIGIAPQNRGNSSRVYITVNGITTKEDMKNFFLNNPTKIQLILATPTIKTVDLTILDQKGQNVKQLMSFKGGTHFNTRSSEGSLLPTVSVSVETDLEETLKMCSLEGNTM